MDTRNKLAFACIAIPTLVELGLGVVYFLAHEPMPYHKQVLGIEWDRLPTGVRTMLVALVNGYGSAHFGLGLALAWLLAVPFRRGEHWARWAILAAGFPLLAGTAWISTFLGTTTGAATRWQGATALLVMFIAGVALYKPRAQ
jgi:hypothetical protein